MQFPPPDDDHKAWLRDALHQESQGYDRAVLAVSTGALALSIAFVGDIAPHPSARWLLALAWLALASSVATVIGSMLASQHAIRAEYARETEGPESLAGRMTGALNILSGIALALGATLLAIFAIVNL